jgi:pilus assembly protein CpaF
MRVIERIVSSVGRRIDESSPMVDARLQDGSRVNAIIPPLSIDGPVLSIRRFGAEPLRMNSLIENKGADQRHRRHVADVCQRAPERSDFRRYRRRQDDAAQRAVGLHSENERIVTIEDSAELATAAAARRPTRNEAAQHRRRGEVTQRDLVRNALRMRPDRIVIGEVRGGEAIDMLAGHEHRPRRQFDDDSRQHSARRAGPTRDDDPDDRHASVGSRDAPAGRVGDQPRGAGRASVRRFAPRHSISEITGMEGETITMQEIFHVRAHRRRQAGPGHRTLPPDRNSPALRRTTEGVRHAVAARLLRGDVKMMISFLVFVFALFLVLGAYLLARTDL